MGGILHIRRRRFRRFSDIDVINGLQCHDTELEKYFFDTLYRYFEAHFNLLFFDNDSKEEVFQTSIIKLWTEIENKTIKVVDGMVCRKQKAGDYQVMTASLTTFLMTFAKNEFRELLRNHADDRFEDIMMSHDAANIMEDCDEDEKRIQIIDDCIMSMSPNCIEIITLFYYQQKTLDEIMAIRGVKNSSKDGLKTAKNKCMVTLRKRVTDRINRI